MRDGYEAPLPPGVYDVFMQACANQPRFYRILDSKARDRRSLFGQMSLGRPQPIGPMPSPVVPIHRKPRWMEQPRLWRCKGGPARQPTNSYGFKVSHELTMRLRFRPGLNRMDSRLVVVRWGAVYLDRQLSSLPGEIEMARILVPRITPERPVRRGHSRFSLSLIFLLALFSVRGWSQSLVI